MKLCLFLVACAALAQDGPASGKWSGIFREGPIFLIIHQDGNKLTGSGGPTEKQQMIEFKGGSIDGDHVAFVAAKFHFDLRLQGDEMRGEMTVDGSASNVFLKRAKEGAAADNLSFEVASVKHAQRPADGRMNSSMKMDQGRVTMTNVTLRNVIRNIYDLKDYQIVGPQWIDEEIYNIAATMPAQTTGDEAIKMIKNLLVERFHLATHIESKEMPVYALVIGKNGPKMQEVEFGGRSGMDGSPGKLTANKIPMANFAAWLSRNMERPVIDATALKGFYDFKLEWTPDERGPKPMDPTAIVDNAVGPSLAAALQQQIGLKLEPRKAPVEIMVIDRVDRSPVEN